MNKSFRTLQLRQLDKQLQSLASQRLPARPSVGWIQAIRESLGMTAVALARRLNMRSSSIHKFERAEIDESITLASLRKVAAALDCELQYVLVPRKPLETMLQDQAKAIAKKTLLPVAHTMALEDQAVSNKEHQAQIEMLAKELLDGSWRELW